MKTPNIGSQTGVPPTARVGLGIKIASSSLALIGLVLVIGGLVIGGGYVGFSGHTTGEVVSVNAGRPTVRYMVDNTTYENWMTEHGPQFAVGQQIELCYNPAKPSQAETCSARGAMVGFSGVGVVVVAVAVSLLARSLYRRQRTNAVIQQGHTVMARVTGTKGNSAAHMGSTILWRIDCAWTDPATGRDYAFRSPSFWSATDPAPMMAANNITSLPVYVDAANPDKNYFVDIRPSITTR